MSECLEDEILVIIHVPLPLSFTLPLKTVDIKYQQKLNKIMKISQKDTILITNLHLSKQYGARRLLSEFPDNSWKLGSIDSLLKRIR